MRLSLIFFSLILLTLTGCLYRMPTNDDLCTLPNMNNPTLTRERPANMIPGQG